MASIINEENPISHLLLPNAVTFFALLRLPFFLLPTNSVRLLLLTLRRLSRANILASMRAAQVNSGRPFRATSVIVLMDFSASESKNWQKDSVESLTIICWMSSAKNAPKLFHCISSARFLTASIKQVGIVAVPVVHHPQHCQGMFMEWKYSVKSKEFVSSHPFF